MTECHEDKVPFGAGADCLDVTSGPSQVTARKAALRPSQPRLDSNQLGYDVGARFNIDVLE
jgi:hypothetical protein